jgi:hypothetical protein
VTFNKKSNACFGGGCQVLGILTIDQAISALGLEESIQNIDGGCLTCAIFTQQSKYTALTDMNVQVFVHHFFAVVMRQVVALNHISHSKYSLIDEPITA